MNAEIDNLKSQMEALKSKITGASKRTNARFKKKKIRSMKHKVDKVAVKLRESEGKLKLLEPRISKNPSGAPHPSSSSKCIESKIAELNKKIRRAKNGRNKRCLIAKRDSLRLDLSWGPRLLEGAFNGAYRRYRIDGIERMDVNTISDRTRKFLIELLSRETTNRAVSSQATTWIRFIKDGVEQVELVFNNRMLAVYNLSDMNGLVSKMKRSRDEHLIYCQSNETVRIEMPNKDPIVKYSDDQYQFKVPFMMHADFESILELVQGASNNPNVSSTRGVNVHTPSGWCIYSKFAYGDVTNPCAQYRGSDCVEKFCEHIISEAKRLDTSFPERPMTPLTSSQLKEYKRATKCHICFKPFTEKNGRVRDHCHYSGLY